MFFRKQDMKSFIYEESTIAFVTAAAQTCLLIEKSSEHERAEWREQLLRLLPVLYLRTRLVPEEEALTDEEPQRFVTEEDYNYVLIGYRRSANGLYIRGAGRYLPRVERLSSCFPDRTRGDHARCGSGLPRSI